jgi:oligopeptidase B
MAKTARHHRQKPVVQQPPQARRIPAATRVHGHTLADDYRWMRAKADPAVKRYLTAENAYAEAMMAPTGRLQRSLYKEMIGHIREDDASVPYFQDGYYYSSRWEKGRQYPIYMRRKGSLKAREQVILDMNALARGEKYMALGDFQVSDDGRLLAYSTDNTGFRQYRLHLRDLKTGKDLKDSAEKTGSLAWDNSNQVIYYTVEDAAKRHYRLYRHALGARTKDDKLVYEETDERFSIDVERSRSGRFLFLTSASHTTSEVRALDLERPGAGWRLLEKRRQGVEYYADHAGDHFYIRANDKGRNYRLVRAPLATPARKSWQELVPARKDIMLMDLEVFKTFYALHERVQGLPQLTLVDLKSGKRRSIKFPEPVYAARPQINAMFSTRVFRYAYQSLVTPPSVYDFDLKTGASKLLKRDKVPRYNPAHYESKRLWARARDGARVPVSLVYRKDLLKRGKNALSLYGYGSYGHALPANFSASRLSLIDRGVVLAYAHVRGGGDLGKPWHDAGRLMKKMNSFTDFIACAEYLVARGFGAPGKLVAEGASAGGLLVAGAANLRPDLFRAVLCDVPFVDVMNTMLDASLPLTVGEYEEWGNPNKKADFRYMLRYSPYDNLKSAAYPAMLVRASFNDSQVPYWEAAKYVAKLRRVNAGDRLTLLKTDMSSGHGGASGRYDYLKDLAFDDAFVLTQLGLAPKN